MKFPFRKRAAKPDAPAPQDAPDLRLIERVQQARMAHDAEALPSQVGAVYWIEAKPALPVPAPTARAGYWLVVSDAAHADSAWMRVRDATLAGELGYKAKVATISHSGSVDERVIHVLTHDADDAADVARVQARLLALGLPPARYVRA